MLSPNDANVPHARLLGDIAHVLSNQKIRKKILKAKPDEELLERLTA